MGNICCNFTNRLLTGILPGNVSIPPQAEWTIFALNLPTDDGVGWLTTPYGQAFFIAYNTVSLGEQLQAIIPGGLAGAGAVRPAALTGAVAWVGLEIPNTPDGWTWYNNSTSETTPVEFTEGITNQALMSFESDQADYSGLGGVANWYWQYDGPDTLSDWAAIDISHNNIPVAGFTTAGYAASLTTVIKALHGQQASVTLDITGDLITITVSNIYLRLTTNPRTDTDLAISQDKFTNWNLV